MLDKVMASEYRKRFLDSDGKGIVYNWHCVDNVGVLTNERRRDLGFGNIFRHYKRKSLKTVRLIAFTGTFTPFL